MLAVGVVGPAVPPVGVPVLLTPAVELVSTRFDRLAGEVTEVVAPPPLWAPPAVEAPPPLWAPPIVPPALEPPPAAMTVALLPPNIVEVAPVEIVAPAPAAGSIADETGEAKLADGSVARAAPAIDPVLFPPPGDVALPGGSRGLAPRGVGSP